jgi:hypothetical protein
MIGFRPLLAVQFAPVRITQASSYSRTVNRKGLLRPDRNPGFQTPTGKAELYSVLREEWGLEPVVDYEKPLLTPVSQPELVREYPLILSTGRRSAVYFHAEHRNIPWLRQLDPDPVVEIHPNTAQALGIGEMDSAPPSSTCSAKSTSCGKDRNHEHRALCPVCGPHQASARSCLCPALRGRLHGVWPGWGFGQKDGVKAENGALGAPQVSSGRRRPKSTLLHSLLTVTARGARRSPSGEMQAASSSLHLSESDFPTAVRPRSIRLDSLPI